MAYLNLRIENLKKQISSPKKFRLNCNHKKENFKHNIHLENLETSYKTINTIVDLIINFSKNFNKKFSLDPNKIKKLENKVDHIEKNLDYIQSLDLVKENKILIQKIKQLEDSNKKIIKELEKVIGNNKENTTLLKELNRLAYEQLLIYIYIQILEGAKEFHTNLEGLSLENLTSETDSTILRQNNIIILLLFNLIQNLETQKYKLSSSANSDIEDIIKGIGKSEIQLKKAINIAKTYTFGSSKRKI